MTNWPDDDRDFLKIIIYQLAMIIAMLTYISLTLGD